MIQPVPGPGAGDKPGEWVSLAQASRRVGLSRSRISQLRQQDPAFPPTRPTASSLLVSWPAFQRWFAHRPRRTRGRTLPGQAPGDGGPTGGTPRAPSKRAMP